MPGSIPLPALTVGNIVSQDSLHIFVSTSSVELTAPSFSSATKSCEEVQNYPLFLQDSTDMLYRKAFYWRYQARVVAKEACLPIL